MHEADGPNKTPAEIPFSVLEYTAVFQRPILEGWTVPAVLIAAALDALQPSGFKLEGVEVKTNTEKLSDYAIVLRRNPPGITFTLALGKLVVAVENLDWSESEQFMNTAQAGIDAILKQAKAETSAQLLTFFMHVQLKTRTRQEITAPLLTGAALNLLDGEIKFPGIILQREKATIVVDGSLVYANGLFVRISREHAPDISLQQIAETLRTDGEQLFSTLGLEGW